MFSIEIDVPNFELKIDIAKIVRVSGEDLARKVARRLRAGVSPGGHQLPKPKSGGAALHDTGQMINSVQAREVTTKRGETMIVIEPSGPRVEKRGEGYERVRTKTSKGKMRALTNIRLAKILESKMGIDIVGLAPGDDRETQEVAQREVDRQIMGGEIDIISKPHGPGF
jgi:hypothetical protein